MPCGNGIYAIVRALTSFKIDISRQFIQVSIFVANSNFKAHRTYHEG